MGKPREKKGDTTIDEASVLELAKIIETGRATVDKKIGEETMIDEVGEAEALEDLIQTTEKEKPTMTIGAIGLQTPKNPIRKKRTIEKKPDMGDAIATQIIEETQQRTTEERRRMHHLEEEFGILPAEQDVREETFYEDRGRGDGEKKETDFYNSRGEEDPQMYESRTVSLGGTGTDRVIYDSRPSASKKAQDWVDDTEWSAATQHMRNMDGTTVKNKKRIQGEIRGLQTTQDGFANMAAKPNYEPNS